MPDEVQSEPATLTQSTGDIVSVVQASQHHPAHPTPARPPSPLRKASSDNQRGSSAWSVDDRDSRRSPCSGGSSPNCSESPAVGSKSTGPAIIRAPVLADLSVGDQVFPCRATSLPTSPRKEDEERLELGRRSASEQRGCFESEEPTATLVFGVLAKNGAELSGGLDEAVSGGLAASQRERTRQSLD